MSVRVDIQDSLEKLNGWVDILYQSFNGAISNPSKNPEHTLMGAHLIVEQIIAESNHISKLSNKIN